MTNEQIIEVLKNYKNKSNKDIIFAMDFLNEDFGKTKDLLIKLSKHLDTTEESYYKLLEEFKRRTNNG
jgi:DNA anti-recombination protein RmuC